MNKVIIGSSVGAVVLSAAICSLPAFADDVVDIININVPVSCSLSGTNLVHTKEMQAKQYANDIGSATITASCNDANGFSVYAIGFTDDTYGNTNLHSSSLGDSFDIVTGKATSGNESNWAMKLTPVAGTYAPTIRNDASYNYTNFEVIPEDFTKVATYIYATGTGVNNSSSFTTNYAAYVSSTQAAGTYTGQVKFTLVHPNDAAAPEIPGPKTIANATTMQEVNSCPSSLPTGNTYTLTDTRDNEQYIVAKLADDNCWMLDNLRLGGNTAMTLTSSDTNIESNFTLPASSTTGFSEPSGAFVITPAINTASKNTLSTNYGPGSGKAGVYYNFCAATAGDACAEIDDIYDNPIQHDVCPLHWRMPNDIEYGYSTVIGAYDYNTDDASDPDSLQYNLSTPSSGFFYDGSLRYFNQNGNYWAALLEGSQTAYVMLTQQDYVDTFTPEDFYYGMSVRCLMPATND